MKNIITVIILLFSTIYLRAQGIEMFHGKWAEALELAKTQDKLIFVDAFAQWCGPCKRMAAEVFTKPEAGAFYNKNFICVKMDMESEENVDFSSKYAVSAYPTLFFINAKGEIVQKIVGGQSLEGLLDIGKKALGKLDNSGDWQKKYDAGDKSAATVYGLIKALNKAGKPSLKIANDYLNANKNDLTTDDNLKIIFEGASECDSRIFDLLIQNKTKIAALQGEAAFKERIETACQNTAQKAVQFKSEELLNDAKAKMKKYCPDKADEFALDTDIKYCIATKNAKGYLKACDECLKEKIKNDASQLNKLAIDMYKNFGTDKKVMKSAERISKKAAENGGLEEYYISYLSILVKNDKKDLAIKTAQKYVETSKTAGKPATRVEGFLEQVKQG
ncbi:MAG: hypothetical protein RLZZ292_729 [Bacteroidota bacterium]|jgi:thiol-disulfide isomerase/thioredoxin